MSISVHGKSHEVPPGFRFHPTEEELLQYYLRKKVALDKVDLDVIQDVDLNKLEPWDIQEKCKIGFTPQNEWYFFSHKDKKYPTGTRTNRATSAGFWKATGRDKVIYSNSRQIGMRKTLVFYKGRAPSGQKSDWIMHEYRLDENSSPSITASCDKNHMEHVCIDDVLQEEGWVICRVFKKKNHSHRSSAGIRMLNTAAINDSMCDCDDEENLKEMLHPYPYNPRNHQVVANDNMMNLSLRFLKLPSLRGISSEEEIADQSHGSVNYDNYSEIIESSGLQDWAALEKQAHEQLSCFINQDHNDPGLLLTTFVKNYTNNSHGHDTDQLTPQLNQQQRTELPYPIVNQLDSQNDCYLWRDHGLFHLSA